MTDEPRNGNSQQDQPTLKRPRRVIGTLVHYIYDDDEEYEEDLPSNAAARRPDRKDQDTNKQRSVVPTMGTRLTSETSAVHTIYVDYGYDSHSAIVDGGTFARIVAGECVTFEGQGFWHEEEGECADSWHVDLTEGYAGFSLNNCGEYEARSIVLGDNGQVIDLASAR